MNDEEDVIVVGSGTGGSMVAREMTLRWRKVLLLERGGLWCTLFFPTPESLSQRNRSFVCEGHAGILEQFYALPGLT